MQWTENLVSKSNFSRADIMSAFETSGIQLSPPLLKKRLQEMLDNGTIARVGRNAYCIPDKGERIYTYQYR